jgi:hypothetical protein
MTFQKATSQEQSYEDQDGQDYIRDDGGFAISCVGHYTIAELEYKIACLKEANRFFNA